MSYVRSADGNISGTDDDNVFVNGLGAVDPIKRAAAVAAARAKIDAKKVEYIMRAMEIYTAQTGKAPFNTAGDDYTPAFAAFLKGSDPQLMALAQEMGLSVAARTQASADAKAKGAAKAGAATAGGETPALPDLPGGGGGGLGPLSNIPKPVLIGGAVAGALLVAFLVTRK